MLLSCWLAMSEVKEVKHPQFGVACWQEFKRLFSTPRFETLKNSGARVQRPLWASTSTKNPAYRDVLYAAEGHRGEEDGTWVIRRT